MVDVEGEETAVVGEDAPEEEEAQDKPTGSPDADTTILFTKPAQVPGTILGKFVCICLLLLFNVSVILQLSIEER